MSDLWVVLIVIAAMLVVMKLIMWTADKVLGTDSEKPAKPPPVYPYKRPANIHNYDPDKKQDLRYDPLAIDEDVCCFRSPIHVGDPKAEPVVPQEQVDEYLDKVRVAMKRSPSQS